MAIALATIGASYDLVGTAAATTATAKATLDALGIAPPAYPAVATTDASYNSVTTTRATWLSDFNTATAAYNVAVTAQRAAEAACVALMVPNEWLKMTSLANFGAVTTQYIGIATNLPSNVAGLDTVDGKKLFTIWTYPTLPTRMFPNV